MVTEAPMGGQPLDAHAERRGLRRWTAERLRELDLRPSRDLGQNFLVDERFLDAVEEVAALEPGDVVLEVGGGLGVLSRRLAPRVAHLHVVEVDTRLAAALEQELSSFRDITIHRADAVRLDFAALVPPPTKLVGNLPYGVAATVLLKALEELPGAGVLVAMVQREVAERLAAAPGSRVYGTTSVLAQLSCEVEIHRRVPRAAFHPAPQVDSAIVVLRRHGPAPPEQVRAFVRDAFAHRRKTLVGSLGLAHPDAPSVREQLRRALLDRGHPEDIRAERLSPRELEDLSLALAGDRYPAETQRGP